MTSGVVEGMNNQVKLIERQAYGFVDFVISELGYSPVFLIKLFITAKRVFEKGRIER